MPPKPIKNRKDQKEIPNKQVKSHWGNANQGHSKMLFQYQLAAKF